MSIFKQDDFKGDPYGLFTNQSAHTWHVGVIGLTYLATLAYYKWFGEFPYKLHIIAFGAMVYAAYEMLDQGWHGWDTFHDFRFVVGWGVAAPVYIFSEVAIGSDAVIFYLSDVWPLLLVFYADLLFLTWRARPRADKTGHLDQRIV